MTDAWKSSFLPIRFNKSKHFQSKFSGLNCGLWVGLHGLMVPKTLIQARLKGAYSFSLQTSRIQHHWLLRKYENNESLEKKCTYCTKGFTNRFGIQTSSSRTLISCSWCKIVLHLKCYTNFINDNTNNCNLGEFDQLIVPPYWIIKLIKKNVSIHFFQFRKACLVINQTNTFVRKLNLFKNSANLILFI